MSILRGGKRIGGFDIRVGLPRDRSLENVEKDPRFKQQAGGNQETTMGRVQSYINEAEGFARKARFYVEFNLPRSSGSVIGPVTAPSQIKGANYADDLTINGINLSTAETEALTTFKDQSEMIAIQKANARRVQAFCSGISMPDRTIETKEIRHHGPGFKVAYDYKMSDITATFYADKFLRERSYFEAWQAAVFSNESQNYNFYDNYVSDVNIFQLGSYGSRNERDDVTYAVKLFEVFPKVIGPVEYSHETNDLQKFDVTFTFRNWINYFLDRQGDIEVGKSQFSDVTVKQNKASGLNGILGKLPPELRRAGRDVVEGLKRRVPVGVISGGRAFPPFPNFPPLNL